MTIFLKVCQELLPKYLHKINERSIAADQSLGNTMLTKVGFGRDLELSASKRSLLEQLLRDLIDLKDCANDQETLLALKDLLDNCRDKAREASDAKSLDEGSFGPDMRSIVALLHEISTKIAGLGLHNIPETKDPTFNVYYFIGLYSAKKVAEAHYESMVAGWAKKTFSLIPTELGLEKDQLVKEALADCSKKLSWLNQALPNYAQCRKETVLEIIEKVIADNQALCRRHDPSLTLGKQIELKLPALGPSYGFLEECMKRAAEAINTVEISNEASQHAETDILTPKKLAQAMATTLVTALQTDGNSASKTPPQHVVPLNEVAGLKESEFEVKEDALAEAENTAASARTSPAPNGLVSVAAVSMFAAPKAQEDATEKPLSKKERKLLAAGGKR